MAFYNDCVDPSSLDSFIEYGQSPVLKGKGRLLSNTFPGVSTIILPADMSGEEPQQRMQPSHNYGQYKQQTGLPLKSSYGMLGNSTSGIPEHNSEPIENMIFDTMAYPITSLEMNSPSDFKWDSFLDNEAFDGQSQPQAPTRVFPGHHQQMATEQQRLRQQQLQLEAEQERQSKRVLDQRAEETIHRVMTEMRRSSQNTGGSMSPPTSHVLPHIARAKKDDEEMDEDERLLNSEEGRKLSSKERRQLRNKVSARAFRSRRKEYISQLEGEVAGKINETNELKRMNMALMEENARYKSLAQKLLAHPAFHPFIKDLSQDASLAEALGTITNPSPMPKDIDPYSQQQQQQQQYIPSSNNDAQIGMTLVPEIPVDLSNLNIGNNWTIPASRPLMGQFAQPQVFAVTEIPEPIESIDFSSLSGKSNDDILNQFTEESNKTSLSEIELPPAMKEISSMPSIQEIAEEEASQEEEEYDESMALYAPTRSSPVSNPSNSSPQELLASLPSKPQQFNYIVASERSDVTQSAFDMLCARLESRTKKVENLLSSL